MQISYQLGLRVCFDLLNEVTKSRRERIVIMQWLSALSQQLVPAIYCDNCSTLALINSCCARKAASLYEGFQSNWKMKMLVRVMG